MQEQRVADALAQAAIAPIQSGMLVGLGTGRAAKRGIRALAERVRTEQLDIRCVATSNGSEALAQELGLQLTDFHLVERVDYTFDGADQVDRGTLGVLKGGGGAMTRERLVAWASDKVVYMVDQSKLSDALCRDRGLAIAVLAFGLSCTRAYLRERGVNGVVRRDEDGKLFITDNGNLVLDAHLEDGCDLEQLAAFLNDVPGVIDHGLFLDEADEIIVETDAGQIERLVRG